jgi:hypothetical protein
MRLGMLASSGAARGRRSQLDIAFDLFFDDLGWRERHGLHMESRACTRSNEAIVL